MRLALPVSLLLLLIACAHETTTRVMECTGYCGCGECNGYTRGNWYLLKLDFWNRYVDYGDRRGERYTGFTAGGHRLHTPEPGLFSLNTLTRPWMLPVRLILPWKWLPRDGTIAADIDHYPFGTRMHIPGWGWGVVDDVGGAIQGPTRLDLYHRSHGAANSWGRRNVEITIQWQ
jgi:3D (Asp-Asp-Asp) domain-containing protein